MRVWRSVELDRIGRGQWRLRWERAGVGRDRGGREEVKVTGSLPAVLRIVPRMLPKLNRYWWPRERRLAARPPLLPDIDSPDVRHLDGVWWHAAPVPDPGHACWVQTSGWAGSMRVERCACGGTRLNGRGDWFDRNTRGPR